MPIYAVGSNHDNVNRMEAALAEFRAEDVGVDMEEDVEFTVEKGWCSSC